MPEILKTSNDPLDRNGHLNVPAMLIPSFRMHVAREGRHDKFLLFNCTGGIGDYVCAEPSFRYALNRFKDSQISLSTNVPELFRHLNFAEVYDWRVEKPDEDNYLSFKIIQDNETIQTEFLTHLLSHCVDYTSLNMFRCQLPVKDRCVMLVPAEVDMSMARDLINTDTDIAIHAGRSWQSKTFPKAWWDAVLAEIISHGKRPVLIGANSAEDRGTVEVNTEGCLDLRNELTIMESVAVLQTARVLLTNDSSPLHMAASGDAWIGFVSTVRHPDYITHWRNGGQWSWRMENLSRGGMWETANLSPNNFDGIKLDIVDFQDLMAWLPEPKKFAQWGVEKLWHTPPQL